MTGAENLWDIGELPFHIGTQLQPTNPGLPDTLPFSVGVDTRTGRLQQMPNAEATEALSNAYRAGSQIGIPMSDDGLGQRYADEFLDFLDRNLKPSSLRRARLLEIGCARGYLLKRLHDLGATVTGCEPAQTSTDYADQAGLPVRPSAAGCRSLHSPSTRSI